jgi:acetyl-CoA acetyltransferase
MNTYGTTSEALGAIAVAQRAWAGRNPMATMRDPLTLADHQASRMIADPLHLLDCCLVSNGGIAVIVTSAERAAELRQPPVHVWGYGQGHTDHPMTAGSEFGLRTGAVQSGHTAMRMAGTSAAEIDIVQLYDCYTYTVLVTLEDYGFCEKGEGADFVADGKLAPGGALPCNTGGGQLSAFYMWGMTPLSEAIVQIRGQGGDRQVDRNDLVLVSGNGGVLEHHSTLILSSHPKGP